MNSENQETRLFFQNVMKLIIRFEREYSDLDINFWAYIELEEIRESRDNFAIQSGYANYFELLLSKMTSCSNLIEDISTEVGASGWTWDLIDEVSEEYNNLMDATESLIEAGHEIIGFDEISEIIKRIPKQRFAPIELVELNGVFALRKRSHISSKEVAKESIYICKSLSDEAADICDELSNSNCDQRFARYFGKIANSISKNEISAIEFGMKIYTLERMFSTVGEELAPIVKEMVAAFIINSRIFVNNLEGWKEFLAEGTSVQYSKDAVESVVLVPIEAFQNKIFSEEVVEIYTDCKKNVEITNAKESVINNSLIQSFINIISVTSKHAILGIKYIRNKVAEKIFVDTSADLFLKCLEWVGVYAQHLLVVAKTDERFSWIALVVNYIIGMQ